MKRLLSSLLVAVMIVAFSAAAFAGAPVLPGTQQGEALNATVVVTAPLIPNIVLSWATGDGITTPSVSNNYTINATAGSTFRAGVRLQNTGNGDLNNALVVMTITDASDNAVMSGVTATDVASSTSVGKNDAGGYYYWGPSTGFTVTTGWDATTLFDVTFANAGTYSISICVVQLNQA